MEEQENICRLDAVTPLQQDVLQELVNIGMGRAAGALNQMTRCHVELQAPVVRLVQLHTLRRYARSLEDTPLDVVRLTFSGGFNGTSCLFFSREAGSWLVELMFGDSGAPEDLTPYRSDTLREVGNIVLIWIMGAIANAIGSSFEYRPLEHMNSLTALTAGYSEEGQGLMIKATFSLRDAVIQGEILMLFDGRDCYALLEAVDRIARDAL